MQTSRVLKKIFNTDLRNIALLRCSLAILVLVDLIHRSFYLSAHYSDYGLLPRVNAIELTAALWQPSFHLSSGTAWFQGLLFALHGTAAFFMLIGYRSRLACFITWLFTLSLHNRNRLITGGADELLIVLLFWAMFLPLGAKFAIDQIKRKKQNKVYTNNFFSVATAGLMIQVMCVYFFTALLKTGAAWLPDGTAVYYALHIDRLVSPAGIWFRQFPDMMQVLSYFVILFEFIAPVLMFSPWATQKIRAVLLPLFISMHLGFLVFMHIGFFPVVSIISLMIFIPTNFWDSITSLSKKHLNTDSSGNSGDTTEIAGGDQPSVTNLNNGIACLCITLILTNNVLSLREIKIEPHPLVFHVSQLIRLQQGWIMFSPQPPKEDYWVIIKGQRVDGKVVDVLNNTLGEPDWSKPQHVADTFSNFRWRYLSQYLWKKRLSRFRQPYARYLCRNWNMNEPDTELQLKKLEIFYMLEITQPDYQPSPIKPVKVWTHDCLALSADEIGEKINNNETNQQVEY